MAGSIESPARSIFQLSQFWNGRCLSDRETQTDAFHRFEARFRGKWIRPEVALQTRIRAENGPMADDVKQGSADGFPDKSLWIVREGLNPATEYGRPHPHTRRALCDRSFEIPAHSH